MSLTAVSTQVSKVMMSGQQLKDSCDHDELDTQLKELAALWSELDSELHQRVQYLQGILLRLGQSLNYHHCIVIRNIAV